MTEVTRILRAIGDGDGEASARELLPLVYNELHRLAATRISHEKPGQTLQTTDLVHEAYLRLVGDEQVTYKDRAHFFGAAAEAMRRILIERARRRQAAKRGGGMQRVDAEPNQLAAKEQEDRILQLHEALQRLELIDDQKAQIVKLRFFTGLTNREVADILSLSTATTERYWNFSRAWLQREMLT